MIVAVIGSRNWTDYGRMKRELDKLPGITRIVSGGATGADTLAEQYALDKSIPVTVIRPEYARYGRRAPLKRNVSIVNAADTVIAFWDGASRGTMHAVSMARRKQKPVILVKE